MLPRAHWQLGSELEIENAFSNSASLPRIVVHHDVRSRRRAFCDGPARQMSRSHSIPLPPPLLPFRPAPERFAVRGSRHRINIDPVPELRRAVLLTDSATRTASAFRQPRIRGDLASVHLPLLLQKPFPCDVASLGRSSASVQNSHLSASGKGDFSPTSPSNVESRRRKNYPRGRVSSFASVGETPSRACEVDTGGGLTKYSDFLVVGSGIAGLRYALAVAEHGTVNVVTKSEPHESNTQYAQGGVSAVLDPLDSVESHIRDTIVAGAFLCDEETVEVVCREGPERVRELMEMGVLFDHSEDGQLHLAREGGHSHHRIVHAADMTGREIERALLAAVIRNPNIKVFEHHCAVDLLTLQDGATVTCYGVDALDIRCNQVVRFLGGVTLLASGGSGHIYPSTTNPLVSTGDGVALANRAHAVVSNMEFVQFHPTALADEGLPIRPPPRENAFLITEAVRGDGGLLYNLAKERFMHKYDPREELAPRDVVARSIDDQLKKRNEKYVYLDISHKPAEAILAHFPNIAAECMKYGLDITKDPIPVVPAAHYMCGGIQTGLLGETSIMGLYAAGEVTCTGLHGANRLASNSLLEALVFAQRAVEPSVGYVRYMAGMQFNIDEASEWPRLSPCSSDDANMEKIADFTRVQRKKLQQTMWEYVGIVRSTDRLKIAQTLLNEIQVEWEEFLYRHGWNPSMVGLELCEMRNLITVANLVVSSAMVRQESRGLHFTVDFPELVESERQATMLFPSTPMTTTWSSQQVHTMSLKSMPLPVSDPPLPIHPQKKIDR